MFQKFLLNWFLSKLRLPRDVHRYAFAKFSDRILLKTVDTTLTYKELENRSYRLVAAWQAAGLGKGDIIFAQVQAEKELFEIRTAALELGIILTTFHQAHPAEFIVDAAGKAPPKLFIVDPAYGVGSAEVMRAAVAELPIWETGASGNYEQELAAQY